MRNDYRTFVVEPPSLLKEQPQLIDQVVREALKNTVERGTYPATVESVTTRRLEDGRLRVAATLTAGGGRGSYAACFHRNVDATASALERDGTASALERDGITYSFVGVKVSSACSDDPAARAVAVHRAIADTFPELEGQEYRLNHDLYCVNSAHRTPNYVLDVSLTADPRSGLDGRDGEARQARFAGGLGPDLALEGGGAELDREWGAEDCDGVGGGPDFFLAELPGEPRGDEGGGVGGGVEVQDHALTEATYQITVPISRELAQQVRESERDEELVAAALECTFPELRDGEYGFDYELGVDLMRVNLSAQPQQGFEVQAGAGWEVSLAAASPGEMAAAVEANLDDVVREACDGVERSSFTWATTR